jgi:hypothetical protein
MPSPLTKDTPTRHQLRLRPALLPCSVRRTGAGRRERSGHLFQNRPAHNASQREAGGYKSVICEEDPYLLELIRYIHLNPLRANLVQDLKELDNKNPPNPCNLPAPLNRVPFQGVQPGCQETPLAEKTIEDVLLHFGQTKKNRPPKIPPIHQEWNRSGHPRRSSRWRSGQERSWQQSGPIG